MPTSDKEQSRNDIYIRRLMTRMTHFDNMESTMNDGIGSRRSRLSEEALADMEEYVNYDSIYEKKERLEKTAILESTDEGVTVVPYPLHCEPIYSSEGSQSSSEDGTRSPSLASTATSSTQSHSQASTAPSWEMVKEAPFDDINASEISDSEHVEEPAHVGQPNPVQANPPWEEVPMFHSSHIPRHTIYGISGSYPTAGAYRVYSPLLTCGIPFLPSSQDGYPSPRLEPLEEGEEEEELKDLYESIFGRDDEGAIEACETMVIAKDGTAADGEEMLEDLQCAPNTQINPL